MLKIHFDIVANNDLESAIGAAVPLFLIGVALWLQWRGPVSARLLSPPRTQRQRVAREQASERGAVPER